MSDQCLTPAALALCPSCLRTIATDTHVLDDSVHRFVRLIACYEIIIKLLGTAAHAVHIERSLNASYCTEFQAAFVEERPSLGSWLNLLNKHNRYLSKSGPPWLARSMSWLRDSGTKDSALSQLGRYVGVLRHTLPTNGATQVYSGLDCLAQVAQLRNAFSHGALTPRFAERFNELLTAALEALVCGLRLSETWRFVVPLRYDATDPRRAHVMNPEAPDDAARCIPLGDRSTSLQWHSLHLGGSDDSLEEVVSLAPLVRYERTLRDFLFLNAFRDGQTEFLSYRSGDFDVRPTPRGWRDYFGLHLDDLDDAEAVPGQVATQDGPPPLPSTDALEASGTKRQPAPVAELDASPPAPPLSLVVQPPPAPSGPSVRDLVARFLELGNFSSATDWAATLGGWEQQVAHFDDDSLTKLFADMTAAARDGEHSNTLLYFLGSLQQRLGFHSEATALFQELAAKAPSDRDKRSRYGCSLLMSGSHLKSEGKAQHNTALIGRGKTVLSQAKTELKASLFPEPSSQAERWHNVRALSMLVDACCRRGEFAEAAGYCDEGLKLEPSNSRLRSQRLFIDDTFKH